MNSDKTTHILARLETGFRTDGARLDALEKDLTSALKCARQFGRDHGSMEPLDQDWQSDWDGVETTLRRIRTLVNELRSSTDKGEEADLMQGLKAWEGIQAEDANLVRTLGTLRSRALGMNPSIRSDWNTMAGTLESHLETIHACAQASRIKLELLKTHSKEDVEKLLHDVLARLPDRAATAGLDPESYDQEYGKAALQLEQERHKFRGFMDVVKGLLLWVETSEERTRRNLSLKLEHTS